MKSRNKIKENTHPKICQFFDNMEEPMSPMLLSFMQAFDWMRFLKALQKSLLISVQISECIGFKVVFYYVSEQRQVVIFASSVSVILTVFVQPKNRM